MLAQKKVISRSSATKKNRILKKFAKIKCINMKKLKNIYKITC
jgi:hypothetical protein